MKFKLFFILILSSYFIIGQEKKVSGVILNEDLSIYENKIKIYDRDKGLLDETDEKGILSFILIKKVIQLFFYLLKIYFLKKK